MNTMKTFLLLAVLTALSGGAGYAPGGENGMVLALLFIVNPSPGGGLDSLFATHPPLSRRVEMLRQPARRPT